VISVIVVNWNRREMLRGCLESLARQEGADFEIVVVDNGSSDGSAEMVEKEFGGDLAKNVRLIRNSENRGFCAANNQGIRAARGEFIALLNNDAQAEPHWLRALGAVLDGRPRAGMAASKILCWEDPGRIDKAGHLIFLDGQNRGRGTGQLDQGQFDRVEEVLWPDGCAAMYRRTMLEEIGGFDEDFFAYADDAELGLRARIAGWECWYAPEARVKHYRGATLGVDSSFRLQLIERNRVLLVVKLFPWSLLWLNGGFLLARVIAGAWAAYHGRGETSLYPGLGSKLKIAAALLRGHLRAWLLLPKMLRKRRQVRRIRRLSPRQVTKLLFQYRISLRELNTMVAPSRVKL
jgi:GT2 family glycosyltransferase